MPRESQKRARIAAPGTPLVRVWQKLRATPSERRILRSQLAKKFDHCLFAFLRRAREINLSPSAHVLAQEWIQQRIQLGLR